MGRKPKDLESKTGAIRKDDALLRANVKELFKGELEALKPSNRLNANQKKVFKWIADHYKDLGFLADEDTALLEQTAIAIDRLQSIDKMINEDFDLIRDRELMTARDKFTKDFYKGVEYFGLSPTSRAKFGIMMVQAKQAKQEQDPLLKLLKKDAK